MDYSVIILTFSPRGSLPALLKASGAVWPGVAGFLWKPPGPAKADIPRSANLTNTLLFWQALQLME